MTRFEYVTLGLALVGAFLVVYRLGAGLHGLGRRGVVIVVVGGVLLAVTLLYAELLRRYGTPGPGRGAARRRVGWSRDHLGAFPRPIETVLGIPALAWGCHMRARRRQGWWVCAFGVAGDRRRRQRRSSTRRSRSSESGLSVVYGLVVGLVLGFAGDPARPRPHRATRGRGRRVAERRAGGAPRAADRTGRRLL